MMLSKGVVNKNRWIEDEVWDLMESFKKVELISPSESSKDLLKTPKREFNINMF